jgi:hypothetical protein
MKLTAFGKTTFLGTFPLLFETSGFPYEARWNKNLSIFLLTVPWKSLNSVKYVSWICPHQRLLLESLISVIETSTNQHFGELKRIRNFASAIRNIEYYRHEFIL